MKLPSLKGVLMALVARFGNQSPPTPYVNAPRRFFRKPEPATTPKPQRVANRFRSNQRQNRKDCRRAHAAGARNAFA